MALLWAAVFSIKSRLASKLILNFALMNSSWISSVVSHRYLERTRAQHWKYMLIVVGMLHCKIVLKVTTFSSDEPEI